MRSTPASRRRFGPLEPPRAADPLDELILTVLSQHTSDLNAERAFGELRAAYPSWQQVVDSPSTAVADVIRSGGLANTKAPRIQAILREVREREGAFSLDRLRTMLRRRCARIPDRRCPGSVRRPRPSC